MSYHTDRCARDPEYQERRNAYSRALYERDPLAKIKKREYDRTRRAKRSETEWERIRELRRIRRSDQTYRLKEKETEQRRVGIPAKRIQFLLIHAKSRAKKKGLEFSISIRDLLPPPEICPALGITLNYGAGDPNAWNRASIDRIDNSKGYIAGNVAVISRRANWLKNDATVEELEKVVAYAAMAREQQSRLA